DPDLQAAHAAAPWLVIFDDHELDNNWADELPEEPQPGFLERRGVGSLQVWISLVLRIALPVVGQRDGLQPGVRADTAVARTV
ncbi:hypothetical protein C6A85_14165, partial [Mycobacterium sp. ITM-2017-0098]